MEEVSGKKAKTKSEKKGKSKLRLGKKKKAEEDQPNESKDTGGGLGLTSQYNKCINQKPCFLMRVWIAKVTGGPPPIPTSTSFLS